MHSAAFFFYCMLFCAAIFDIDGFEVLDSCEGTTKTCLYFPTGCNETSEPNNTNPCRLVTWQQSDGGSSSNQTIEIELRSSIGAKYIAMAFGRNAFMKDADVYYCTSEGGFESPTITAQHVAPIDSALENGVQDLGRAVIEDRIHCKFVRPPSISKEDSTEETYDYDITAEKFYLLVAEGPLQHGVLMAEHTWKTARTPSINFTEKFSYDMLEPPTMATTVPNQTIKSTTATTLTTSTSSAASNCMSIWVVWCTFVGIYIATELEM